MDLKLLASVNTMLTSFRRTKYINMYKTYISLICQAPVFFLQWCTLTMSLGSPHVCSSPRTRLTGSVFRFPHASSQINTLSLILHQHLRCLQTFWPIKSSFYISKLRSQLRHATTRGFPDCGYKQLKQILFIEMEWKICIKCPWLGL